MKLFSFFRPVGLLPLPMPETTAAFITFAFIVLLGCGMGFLFFKYAKIKWQFNNIYNILIPTVCAAVMFFRFGLSMVLIKGLILLFLLLFASNSDIKTREVSNFIPLAIFITGFINTDINYLPVMFFSMVIISLPQLIVSVIKPGTYGGSDLKIMAASCFLLGFEKGILSLVTGLVVAIISTVIIRKVKNENLDKSFPLVPYLSIGVMFAYLF